MEEVLLQLLQTQFDKYPAMQLTDCIKLLYQRILGSEHMFMEPARCYQLLCDEKKKIGTDPTFPPYEELGGNSCRFHLLPLVVDFSKSTGDFSQLHTLCSLFLKSMPVLSDHAEEKKALLDHALTWLLGWIREGILPFNPEESRQFVMLYRKKGCPAVHHSQSFRNAYHPAYRLLRTDYAFYFSLFARIDQLFTHKKHVILAIDGKCGAGKSTLASLLATVYSCNVIHMDDFYLPADLRTKERLAEAGGNIHHERFSAQVLPSLLTLKHDEPLLKDTSYQVFDCHRMDYQNFSPAVTDLPLTIVEGSYCLRPEFREAYDLKVFLTISETEQKERLLARNGREAYQSFESRWIPMELQYFEAFQIARVCDLTFCTDSLTK